MEEYREKKHDYQKYTGKEKEERRELASTYGDLERKRFLLSRNPELKERLEILQVLVYEMQKEHPEIISLSLFGSLTKGYATPESDYDGYINIDSAHERQLGHKHSPNSLANMLAESLRARLPNSKGQINIFESPPLNGKLAIIEACGEEKLQWNQNIFKLFMLSVGERGKINEYRKIVLDALSSDRKFGEHKWKLIVGDLFQFENAGFSSRFAEKREHLYPKTLEEAKKYFLHE